MLDSQISDEEIAQRGEKIYREQLCGFLEPQYCGQVVVIDVETGEYEVDTDSLGASKRALAKHTGALLYGVRVGSPVVEMFRGPSLSKR
jgi:hypothetical protein